MRRLSLASLVVVSFALVGSTVAMPALLAEEAAEEPVDLEIVTAIRTEGLEHSRVMEWMEGLTVEIGPRLTGSPQMKRAHQWTRDTMAEWRLENAAVEPWGEFGRGWSFSYASVHMLSPQTMPLPALPKAWTPGTRKRVRGDAMKVTLSSEEDMEALKGTLKGKILFLDDSREMRDATSPLLHRYDDEGLQDAVSIEIEPSDDDDSWKDRFRKRRALRKTRNEFLVEEKVLATIEISSRDGNLLRLGGGGSREPGESTGVPALVMGAEAYNQVLRLLDGLGEEEALELEIQVKARFHDDDLTGYNTVAEIPGSDLADELVMIGGHLDSWHAGTGATDNAAGCAMAMEAMRILQAIDAKPRRTIRIGLWSGEEQGLLGSMNYVKNHFGWRGEPDDPAEAELPAWAWKQKKPFELKPEHETFSAYFNLDNGSGRIRGIYSQGNLAAAEIFEAWLRPFHDLDATTVSHDNAGGTDHLAFDYAGLPAFQFIQDRLDYFSRTHHTNADTIDHVSETDLMQGATILASFAYHAAMRDEKMPRKRLPKDEPQDDTEDLPETESKD